MARGVTSDVVYVMGAGLNRQLRHAEYSISPPLISDFFQAFFASQRDWKHVWASRLQPLFHYIYRYWHFSEGDLRSRPLDLEEVFTFITLQQEDALRRRGKEAANLSNLLFLLTSLISYLLGPFEDLAVQDVPAAVDMHRLGDRLLKEEAIILTFNYDTILERAMETASESRPPIDSRPIVPDYVVPDYELSYSRFNWNRALAYGVKFDEVQIDQGDIAPIVDGDRFFDHPENHLSRKPILKLHGSLNWCRYAREERRPTPDAPIRKGNPIFLLQPKWDLAAKRQFNNRFIDPIIITPVLNKGPHYRLPPFPTVWKEARSALSKCRELVIIGYSLPPTDFPFRRVLLEAFESNTLTNLTVVNPDSSVVARFKKLVHYEGPVTYCTSLKEFLYGPTTV